MKYILSDRYLHGGKDNVYRLIQYPIVSGRGSQYMNRKVYTSIPQLYTLNTRTARKNYKSVILILFPWTFLSDL